MVAIPHPPPELASVFGFGVAGNFAGHLEQAGEAADFVGIESDPAIEAPKGIFPWYVPPAPGHAAGSAAAPALSARDADGVPSFLRVFPLSRDTILLPPGDGLQLQIEPEVAVLARVEYRDVGSRGPDAELVGAAAKRVAVLVPEAIGAFNDCSIRRPGAEKISHKKNWGPASKGLAPLLLAMHDLSPEGPTASWRLASFLRRDGQTAAYGVDSPLPGYSYYGDTLLDWLVDRLRHQAGADGTPLEHVGGYLQAAGSPAHVLIGIGATRYTPLGETTYLRAGDESIVIVYDGAAHTPADVEAAVASGDEGSLAHASVLVQRVEHS